MLKALAKKNSTDFDSEYKTPKINKNYKGTEILFLRVPGYSVDASGVVSSEEAAEGEPVQLRASEVGARPSVTSLTPPVAPPSAWNRNSVSAVATAKPAPAPYFTPNRDWNTKWSPLLKTGQNVVYTSLIAKRNPMNMPLKRQLILTDEPSLIYVEVATMKVKGEVEWTKQDPPKATKVRSYVFSSKI
jgi:hypothetical protein